jgi:hypothetical protein
MTYLDDLAFELQRAGIPARRRRRILTEFTDHLTEDPAAELGAAEDLAGRFADELGTRLARAAAFRAFLALAVAGLAMLAMFFAVGRMHGLMVYGGRRHSTPTWSAPLLLAAALAAQLALAAGGLALLRAWRLRHVPVIGAADARILVRRASVGVLAGALTLTALPVIALAYPHAGGASWRTAAWVVCGLGLIGFVTVVPALLSSARLRPRQSGTSGDLHDDLLTFLPWAPAPREAALMLAFGIAVALTIAGIVTDDPYDGALRGIADALACLAGYAALGAYLGLRDTVQRTTS